MPGTATTWSTCGRSRKPAPRSAVTASTSSTSTPDANRIETLTALIAEGYAGQVHLGHDAACFYDFMVGNPFFAEEKSDYLHISTRILPALVDAGVTQEQIDEMLVVNPQRFFAPVD